MALKYIVNFGDRLGLLYRIEIDHPDYVDQAIELEPAETPLILSHEGNSDDDIFKKHVIPSSATINVVSTGIIFDDFFYVNDASMKCRIFRDNVMHWQGYMISDGVQEVDSGVPFDVTLTAIDGLELMDNIKFSWGDNYPAIDVNGQLSDQRCVMNAIRLALFRQNNLDNKLPIRWNSSLDNDVEPGRDMLAGTTVLSPFGDLVSVGYTCLWWLENIAKSAQSWMFQKEGYWYISRYFDTLNSEFNGWQIDSDTSIVQVAQSYDGDEIVEVLPSDTINESWFWTGKKPLGSAEVTYLDTKYPNLNVAPNGGFDIVSTGLVLNWRMSDGTAILPGAPINGESTGNSADVNSILVPTDRTVTFGQIPIDTELLFKDATLGFKWLPIEGYDLTSEGDFIDFTKYPIWISVRLSTDTTDLYLNEFGYWSDKNVEANAQVVSVNWEVSTNALYVQFDQNKTFFVGDEVVVHFIRNGQTAGYRIQFTTPMSVQDGTAYIASQIPQTGNPNNWTIEINNVDNVPSWNNAYTQKSTNYYKQVNIDGGAQMKLNDVLDIQFQSKGLSSNIKLPSQLGKLSVDIYSKAGSHMYLDDFYFRVEDNHDVYEVSVSNSKNSAEKYEMGISSGFSGFMVSSYGDDYSTINESQFWNGGKTLTELYGTSVMQVRNRPSKVFSGTVDKIVDWGLFTLMGKTYAPLSIRTNVKDITSEVVGVEFNPTTPTGGFSVAHRSSADEV